MEGEITANPPTKNKNVAIIYPAFVFACTSAPAANKKLENIYITGPNNQLIQLSSIATIEYETVPRALNRFQQRTRLKLVVLRHNR